MTVRQLQYDSVLRRLRIVGVTQTATVAIQHMASIDEKNLPPNVKAALNVLIEYAGKLEEE